MDNYREIWGEDFRPDVDGSDHHHGTGHQSPHDDRDEEMGCEPPPASVGQDERRMQVRAYNHWSGLLGDRAFPRLADLTADLPDFADYALVLDFSQGTENPAVTMLGARLAQECCADRAIARLSDVPGRSLLSRLTDHYMQVLANQAPVGFEAEFIDQRGKSVAYRGILLPFSSEGDQIDQIMGVINWKELADPTIAAALIGELGGIVGRDDARSSLSRLGAWADGPVIDDRLETDGAALAQSPCAQWNLTHWLDSARELARLAHALDDRSRTALYAAIGRAWDFALAADADPEGFAAILAAAGLIVRARAPMTPVVKLVFGAAYDKTRLAEFATALAHARRLGLERGGLATFLASTPGGLKAVVGMERNRRRAGGAILPRHVHGKLRELPTRPMREVRKEGSEFALLLIRRLPGGRPGLLGEVSEDASLIDRAARHLLR